MPLDQNLAKEAYQARLTVSLDEVEACQRLRHRAFFGRPGRDVDPFDAAWSHLAVWDADGVLASTLRFRVSTSADVMGGYAAAFYGLDRIAATGARVMEVGRLCSDPARYDPQILRVAWAALTRIVDRENVDLIFGCTSFPGVNPAPFEAAFAGLAKRYIAPARLLPTVKADKVIRLDQAIRTHLPQRPMPPLLRGYLTMGGGVSDHAVIDHHLRTMHVLTVLERDQVPPGRAKSLRALGATVGS